MKIDIVFYEKKLIKAQDQKDSAKTALYRGYLSTNRLALADLKEQLEQDYPKYYELKYGNNQLSIQAVQKDLLRSNQALLEYFVGDSSIFVFTITPTTAKIQQLPKRTDLDTMIQDFRVVLTDVKGFQSNTKQAFKDYNEKSLALYDYLVKPVIKDLDWRMQLTIIPDGTLHFIPFEVLSRRQHEKDNMNFARMSYLLYRNQISYGYSAALLATNQERQAQLPGNARCLAFAPPYTEGQFASNRSSGNMQQLRNNAAPL